MPVLTNETRVRVIMDLIHDEIVVDDTKYGGALDKMNANKCVKYATSMAAERGIPVFYVDPNATPKVPRPPTNEELFAFFIQQLKHYVKGIHVHQRQAIDELTARTAAIAAAEADVLSDLGT